MVRSTIIDVGVGMVLTSLAFRDFSDSKIWQSTEHDPHGGLGCNHCGLPKCRLCNDNPDSPYISCSEIPDEALPTTTTTTTTTTITTTTTRGEPVRWSQIRDRCDENSECVIPGGATWILDEDMRVATLTIIGKAWDSFYLLLTNFLSRNFEMGYRKRQPETQRKIHFCWAVWYLGSWYWSWANGETSNYLHRNSVG